MMRFLALPTLILLALALPPAVNKKSWQCFFGALILSFFAVVLPLFGFFASAICVPEWKGGCSHGWLDCFHMGKFALAPLALLATAALYSVEVLQVPKRTERWIVFGIFSGAVISVGCLVFGLACLSIQMDAGPSVFLMVVPLYVAVWYSLRAVQLVKESGMGVKACLSMLLGTFPFWIGSVFWSKSIYASLPDSPPSCFIVTAAGRGHRKFVGPFLKTQRHGQLIQANAQLITFWTFENLWQDRAPRSHAYFRRFYNRLGPAIAAQIRSPLVADLVYVAIKPVELAAKLAIPVLEKNKASKNEN